MAGHIPFVTAIRPGLCRLELEDGSERAGQANGGMLTVGKDMTVLLCGSFTWEE